MLFYIYRCGRTANGTFAVPQAVKMAITSTLRKLYCISGLGADQRLFQNVVVPGFELVHLNWVPPSPADTLTSYAGKMADMIAEEHPCLLGLSMGGMIATEIGKTRETEKIVIVSSAKTRAEVGWSSYAVNKVVSAGIVPASLLNIPYPVALNMLGAGTPEERQLLRQVIRDADPTFMKWAIRAIFSWGSTTWPPNVYHIHGTSDKIILPACVRPDVWVEGGSHIMLLNRHEEVNKLIAAYLLQ